MHTWITILICIATAITSYFAFKNPEITKSLNFRPDKILAEKEFYRLLSCSLIHADWMHAGFNLFALYSFGNTIEMYYGWKAFLTIYLLSVLGGSLLSLFLHRRHEYSSLGASGGVCGIIFASIFLVPSSGIGMFFIPISIPGNIFAICYLLITFYALRKGIGNIGHDAHFGGATVGLIIAFSIRPQFCMADPIFFWGSVLIATTCLSVLFIDPLCLSGKVFPFEFNLLKKPIPFTGNIRYDGMIAERLEQGEIDYILDKISNHGIGSLSEHERNLLERRSDRNSNRKN